MNQTIPTAQELAAALDGSLGPFSNEGGKTFLNYDRLIVRQADNGSGDMLVVLCWRCEEVYEIGASNIDFNTGDTLTLNGMAGRVEVDIAPS